MEINETISLTTLTYGDFSPIKLTHDIYLHADVAVYGARDGRMLTKRGRKIHYAELPNWVNIGLL